MSIITPHESDADLLTPEDVQKDVAAFTNVLLEKQIKNLVRDLMRRSDVFVALQELVASGRFANQADALAHAVRSLRYATLAQPEA